jgi:hypothetical protein
MKFLYVALLATIVSFSTTAMADTSKVCHAKVVKGKTTQVCKTIKVHKKLDDATAIPVKK